jgi:uncharacterized protein (DUF1499 family)
MTLLLSALVFAVCLATGQGVAGGRDRPLAPCPASRNCVSSRAEDEQHRVAPLPFTGTASEAMTRLAAVLRELPRTTIVEADGSYLHAESRSALFRFVDDVEFLADEAAKVIHVRSASRVGSSDLGVNRRRVEAIRKLWETRAP